MIDRNQTAWTRLRVIAGFLVICVLFAVAYAQAPLYSSNQNQYFLHGLAKAGLGELERDWLANTLDPTPLFSAMVEWTHRLAHQPGIFYLFYAILLGVYLYSLIGIAGSLFDLNSSRARRFAFLALLFAVHSTGLRFALSRSLGANWIYVLEDGVADQRLLGTIFQPSTFGVLLVLSIFLFLRRHPFLRVPQHERHSHGR